MISINHVRIANIVVILISALWLYVAGLPEGIVIDCQPATSQQLKSTDRILFIMENSKISKSCKMLEFSGIWSEAKKELLHSLALLLFCIGVLFLIIDPIVYISNKITSDILIRHENYLALYANV